MLFLAAGKASIALAALALLQPIALASDTAQSPFSLDAIPDSCENSCDALGCSFDDSSATSTVVDGSITIPVPATGNPPFSPPPGLEGASQVGSHVGPDGVTTVQWKLSQPSTIFVPNSAPTEPPCASWTVTKVPKTDVVNGVTIVRDEPVLSAVGPSRSTEYVTVISTPPPITQWETTTSVPPSETHTVTSTSEITSWSTSTLIIPPSAEYITSLSTEYLTSISTEYSTLTSVSTSTFSTTETSISTTTSTATVTSTPPPVTTTLTTTSTSTETSVSVSTSLSVSTTTELSVQTQWSTSTAWSTTTSVSTSTTSVSYCPPTTSNAPPTPSTPCVPGITTSWTNVNIAKGRPWSFRWNDPYPALLKVQDAGYKSEKYTIAVDGAQIGTTPDVPSDRNAWCGNSPVSQKTCQAQGFAYGEFNLPAGDHSVAITNVPGYFNDATATESTVFYQVERKCANQYVPPAPACSADSQKGWTAVTVPEGQNFALPVTFNYNFPTKLTFVDGGYKAEKYYVIVDGIQVGWTGGYDTNWGVWCGITADQAQNCVNQGLSSGVFIIPAGVHSVAVSSVTTKNPAWAANSSAFFKIEKYCG